MSSASVSSFTSLLEHLATLEDPRQSGKVIYPLEELLLLVATASGADDFVEMAQWGGMQLDFLRRFLPLRARHSQSRYTE